MPKIVTLAGASCLMALLMAAPAPAGSLTLAGKERWLTIASTKDKDTAIAIAGLYSTERAKVVTTQSGFFAIVLGPYKEGSIEAIRKAHQEIGELPKDALLSRGDKYIEKIYEELPWDEQRVLATYEVNKPVQFSGDGITYVVSMKGDEDNPGPTTATAEKDGKLLFSFTTPTDYSMFGSDAGLIKLDPTANGPQLVFTRFTGGAHCCTQAWIATSPQGGSGWTLVDAGVFDGGGYSYEDADGDGTLELFRVDNDFLYAFDSYAGSFAPIRISHLRGNRLVDISNDPAMHSRLVRDLAAMEFSAKVDPSLWSTNGFLAGWVAAKQRLGQGEEAWQTALENLDPKSDFGPQICTSGQDLENCPAENLEAVPVAKALAQFLSERDYGDLPAVARALLD